MKTNKNLQKNYHLTIFLSIVLFIFLYTTFTACTPSWVTKVTQISDVIWYSENPKIEILILNEDKERGFGYIYNDDSKTDVYFIWRFTLFDFTLASDYGISKSETPRLCINGYYHSLNDKMAELRIDHDLLFNGKYTNHTFIIKSKKVNRNEVDIKYYSNVQWKAISPKFTFSILSEERRRGRGAIEYGDKNYNIVFYWEEGSRFSVYELQNDFQSKSPILSGTYVSENLKATLTIEEDAIFNHEFDTIQLVAKGLNDP